MKVMDLNECLEKKENKKELVKAMRDIVNAYPIYNLQVIRDFFEKKISEITNDINLSYPLYRKQVIKDFFESAIKKLKKK
jgi:hypothetical protein